ncbi:CpaD family pilus assembly lipoprotein [Minwuia thermotolerans]|jgi:type IV pilus biogenesis protein CpaD/CtpE|uniref:Pilus assembly protein CpaD n=1 Tax=Minwuia thermotolerans TaxID=2056226 RepID=A0A2M9G1X1_9PROT|nr:CpaD family pilus assembly lipoprotein [Minwuia thermotolerans]ANK81124.1 MAG: hypothetical protein TEF_10195 [Rhizobiales bacterium NRL2]PJK29713.1 hypothetical protein CVT23_11780 [Minwuia thermotolerans]
MTFDKTPARAILLPLLAVALFGALAGCAENGDIYAGLETPKRIAIDRDMHRFEFGGLDGTEADWRRDRARLDAFIAAARDLPNRSLTLYLPSVMNRREEARAVKLVAALENEGLAPLIGELRAGNAHLDVRTVTTSVPACPDYSRTRIGHANGPGSNFGCATLANLAAMVAEPSDLDAPKEAGPPRGEAAWRDAERHRKGERAELDREQVLN